MGNARDRKLEFNSRKQLGRPHRMWIRNRGRACLWLLLHSQLHVVMIHPNENISVPKNNK